MHAGDGLRLSTVVIDPGHGGKDSGAVSADRKSMEKTFTLEIAKALADKIRAAYPDVKVILTRTDVRGSSLISAAPSPGTNFGWVVIMVLPDPDWGSSSVSRSRRGLSAIKGSTICSIKLAIKVLLPVRTGPTTPIYKSPWVRSAISR